MICHSRIRNLVAFVVLCGAALAQAGLGSQGPATLLTTPAKLGGTLTLTIGATPGALYAVAVDGLPGQVPVPGVGTVWLGLTPGLFFLLDGFAAGIPPMPGSGQASFPLAIPGVPGLDGLTVYSQVVATAGAGFALSNARSIQLGTLDSYHGAFGAMTEARAFQKTAILPNGGYLIVGGGSGALLGPISSANCERYNPYLRTFTPDTAMSTPRTLHTVTTLQDGRVLTTGGSLTGGPGLATTELYDAATSTWNPGPTMNTTRIGHTATMLNNGRILIAGGASSFTVNPPGSTNYLPIFQAAQDTAQVFDPATNTFTNVANIMSSKRFGHAAIKLNSGRVLLCGGVRGGTSLFGVGIPQYATTCDLYDPATNAFISIPNMAVSRIAHTLNLRPDGTVLAVGGAGGTLVATTGSTEIYNEVSNTWTAGPALPGGVTLALQASVTMPDGSIYISGGAVGAVGNFTAVANAYRYTAATGFTLLNPMPLARQAHTADYTPEGVILIGGGGTANQGAALTNAEIWTPTP